jgi:hypothetical protein
MLQCMSLFMARHDISLGGGILSLSGHSGL